MQKKIIAVLLMLFFLTGCSGKNPEKNNITKNEVSAAKSEVLSLIGSLDEYSKELISADFLDWLCAKFGDETLFKLCETLEKNTFSQNTWHNITGNTAIVLNDMYSGALDKESHNYKDNIKVIENTKDNTVIRIVGDVSFADNWKIAPAIESRGKGIYGVLSKETVDILKGADIFLLNNEFTYSSRGTPLAGKAYTFRAAPSRVNLMHEIGADIVSLANNHAYDYGADAFSDTLETLKNANIPYIGGGKNIAEAMKPYYFIVNGRKYAFSAATKAEKNILTPAAEENSSGVLRTYEPAKYIEVIEAAEKECDYNIAYLHWGQEGSHKIEDGLYEMGAKFIDAGADIVVGAHAHVLQGIQYYKGVPIVYNLGNFLFNAKTIDTGILEINILNDGTPEYKFIPAIQENCYTQVVNGDEKARILSFMENLSIGVEFDSKGTFSEQ